MENSLISPVHVQFRLARNRGIASKEEATIVVFTQGSTITGSPKNKTVDQDLKTGGASGAGSQEPAFTAA
jgi:hypothetical protein